jgi:hypothetical protein
VQLYLRTPSTITNYSSRDISTTSATSSNTPAVFPDGHVKDVIEIRGGEGDVTKVSTRQRLSTGQTSTTSNMAKILRTRRSIGTSSLRCTMETCIAIGQLMVEVAKLSIFNERRSILYKWQRDVSICSNADILVHATSIRNGISLSTMCLGLNKSQRQSGTKWTTLWTSSTVVTNMFHNCKCIHAAGTHSRLECNFQGVSRTKLAEVCSTS